jgi:hypothetical protein
MKRQFMPGSMTNANIRLSTVWRVGFILSAQHPGTIQPFSAVMLCRLESKQITHPECVNLDAKATQHK